MRILPVRLLRICRFERNWLDGRVGKLVSRNSRNGGPFGDICLMGCLMLIGLFVRLLFLSATECRIDSDEAIVGLMAKHVLEGRDWPIFYYGQSYMGSMESLLVSAAFFLTGKSNCMLKAVPLIFSLFHIALVYLLATKLTNRFGALLAALLTAVPPSALVEWSTKARGGFIEVVVLGTLAFILSIDLLRADRPRIRGFFLLGLVLGMGWWVNNQIVFYLLPIALVFPIRFVRVMGFCAAARAGVFSSLGFFLGGAPFWYANLAERPYLATFKTLLAPQRNTTFWDHFCGFFVEALPIILGARRFWTDVDIYPLASGAVLFVYALCLLVFLIDALRGRSLGNQVKNCLASALIVLFIVFTPIIFALSPFGWLSKAPRYLLPLYSVIFVIVGTSVAWIASRASYAAYATAILLAGSLLGTNLASNYLGGISMPGEPFVYQGERVQKDHSDLYRWLSMHNYDHIWTNYWIGYRTAFETDEQVTFTRFGSPRSLRIPWYEEIGKLAESSRVYITVPSEAKLLVRSLDAFGYRFRYSKIGSYSAIDRIIPKSQARRKIRLRSSQILTSSRQDWARRMIDRDLGTRWGSGEAQKPGMYVIVSFEVPTEVSGIDLDLGFFVQDAPRLLVIDATTAEGQECQLFDSSGTLEFSDIQAQEFGQVPRKWKIRFRPEIVRQLRLIQLGHAEPFDWSIAELTVWRP